MSGTESPVAGVWLGAAARIDVLGIGAAIWPGHSAVAAAAGVVLAVLGIGESIEVFVTLCLGQQPSDELKAALIRHVREEARPIAAPSQLDFVTGPPKTRSGRIRLRLLEARELGHDPGDITTLEESPHLSPWGDVHVQQRTGRRFARSAGVLFRDHGVQRRATACALR